MFKSPTLLASLCALLLPVFTTGCLDGPAPRPGQDSLISSANEAPGPNCEYGGVRLSSGVDRDRDGVLQSGEVQNVSYACGARVDGATSLIDVQVEPAGANCAEGGYRITSGLDQDDDGVLSSNEAESTAFSCEGDGGLDGRHGTDGRNGRNGTNGTDGHTTLIQTSNEPAGPNCAEGGYRITAGLDENDDGVLSDAEVASTVFSCEGDPGVNGTNGRDGTDGFTALIQMYEEPPTADGECLFGGTRIEAGLDTDRDGELSDSEVSAVQFVCSVPVNEFMTLVHNSRELPGEQCEQGGVRTEIGIDDDNDRLLDPDEVDDVTFLCNEVILLPGQTALLVTSNASEAQCPFGGYLLTSGLDSDYDGILGEGEIANVLLVCDGKDGFTSLSETVPYHGGECSDQGGWHLQTGLDLDYDAKLDADEVLARHIVCNGRDGFLGYDGKNSLIRVTDDSRVCTYGGYEFEVGLDQNENNLLDSIEVQSREYVCDGIDGLNSLVTVVDDHSVCPYGGSLFKVGLDQNHNDVLENGEVEGQTVICDGYDGYDSLIELSDVGSDLCPYGGVYLEVGLDTDEDGYLDPTEIEAESYLCDGYDGYNSLIELSDVGSGICPYGGAYLEVGLDTDEDGRLDPAEVEADTYLCDGHDGYNSLIETGDVSSDICPYGGASLEVGLDLDEDGYLDPAEVEVETYLCDGYNGYNSLVDIVDASYADCPYGGVSILVGLDLDDDGYLDDAEIESEAVICD